MAVTLPRFIWSLEAKSSGTIRHGEYAPAEWAAEVERAMREATGHEWAVTFDYATSKLSFSWPEGETKWP